MLAVTLSCLLASSTQRGPVVLPSVLFAQRNRIELRLDVLRSPDASGAPRPAILFLHGGAWRDGRRTMPNPALDALVARGFVCIRSDYRLSQEAIFPAQIEDVRDALAWIVKRAPEIGVDPERIGVWGMSAGGHLALLAAYAPEAFTKVPGVRVRAVAACYPTTDILGIYRFRLEQKNVRADLVGDASPETQLLGVSPERDPERAAAASPITYVTSDDPPTWLVHGVRDETVPIEQSRTLARRLRQAGVRTEFLTLAALGHEARFEAFQRSLIDFFVRELRP